MQSNPAEITSSAHRYSFLKISNPNALYKIIGKSAKTAPAGAGTPVKYRPERGVLTFSISCVLKRANLKHIQTAKKADIIHPIRFKCDRLYKYMTMAGHSPNTAKSDSESSSAPNRLHELSNRAKRPSVASKKAAITTEITAYSHFDARANLTCIMPTNKAEIVAKFGMTFPIDISLNIFRRTRFT